MGYATSLIINRRQALNRLAQLGLGTWSIAQGASLMASSPDSLNASTGLEAPYSLGACDWSIGMHSDPDAMKLARRIGLDGVQISLGKLSNNMHLRRRAVQRAYQKAARRHGVQIGGLAIGELNNVPYAYDDRTDDWVRDSIGVAHDLGCKVVLLAFFGKGDLKGDDEGTRRVIEKLAKVVPLAEEAGVVLGIESWLSAEEHLHIIESVNSSHLRVYYDVANSHKMGYDIYAEMQQLGTEYICEVHMKENGALLGQGVIDFPRVKAILQDMGYQGWMQIEAAVPQGAEILPSYQANARYLRNLFW